MLPRRFRKVCKPLPLCARLLVILPIPDLTSVPKVFSTDLAPFCRVENALDAAPPIAAAIMPPVLFPVTPRLRS